MKNWKCQHCEKKFTLIGRVMAQHFKIQHPEQDILIERITPLDMGHGYEDAIETIEATFPIIFNHQKNMEVRYMQSTSNEEMAVQVNSIELSPEGILSLKCEAKDNKEGANWRAFDVEVKVKEALDATDKAAAEKAKADKETAEKAAKDQAEAEKKAEAAKK